MQEILSELIYLTLAGINIALPAIWMLAYMYLSLRVL